MHFGNAASSNTQHCNARNAQTQTKTQTQTQTQTQITAPQQGCYFTGDGCRRDQDGYYWITGRVDDVINVSGHRIGTAEVEAALSAHARVAEAAIVR